MRTLAGFADATIDWQWMDPFFFDIKTGVLINQISVLRKIILITESYFNKLNHNTLSTFSQILWNIHESSRESNAK